MNYTWRGFNAKVSVRLFNLNDFCLFGYSIS